MAYPWLGPRPSVLRIKASSAPCSSAFGVLGAMPITQTFLVTDHLTQPGAQRFGLEPLELRDAAVRRPVAVRSAVSTPRLGRTAPRDDPRPPPAGHRPTLRCLGPGR